jgi:PAS domain S-box-containing protein
MKAPRALEWESPILSPSLDRLIATFPLPVIIHDDQDRILQMSEGWTHFSGYTLADVHTLDDWTEAAYGERRGWVRDYIDSIFAEDRTLDHGEWVIRAKDGGKRVWHFLSTPLGIVQGRRLLLAVAADVTELKRTEEALRKTEELLTQGMRLGHLGIFDHDQITDAIYWSPEIWSICLWDPKERPTLAEYAMRIHPDDRDRIVTEIGRAHDPAGNGSYDVEHRIIAGDGTTRWIRVRSQTFFEGTGASRRAVRTVGALMDVTEQKQAEQEREWLLEREQELRSAAEAANRIKDEFLSTLSHELRTPLTSILGWTLLLRQKTFDAETNRALETIERNARAQQKLIEDILDVSRIISSSLRLDFRPTQLTAVIADATDGIHPAAEAKSIMVHTELDPGIVVSGDPDRLQQVAGNLLSNAIKFTPQNGNVWVRLRRKGNRAEFCVQDSGQGIEHAFLPYVFDRFRQADSSTVRRHGGLGLGLAITRHLVELHGGSIRARSLGKDRGATFTIDLPCLSVTESTAGELQPGLRMQEGMNPKLFNLSESG